MAKSVMVSDENGLIAEMKLAYEKHQELEAKENGLIADIKLAYQKHQELEAKTALLKSKIEAMVKNNRGLAQQYENILNEQRALILNEMRQRKSIKTTRKETKNVESVFSTLGDDNEYDINIVLQELEKIEVKTSEKPQRRQNKKRKKKKASALVKSESEEKQNENTDEATVHDANPDQTVDVQINREEAVTNPDQPLVVDEVQECEWNGVTKQPAEVAVKSSEPECSTCFEPRIRTFLLFPCGHATFCEQCAAYFSESDARTCPTCRAVIVGKIRVFQ